MSQAIFYDEKLLLSDFVNTKGQTVKGKKTILQVKPDSTSTPAFGSIPVIKIRRNGNQLLNDSRLVFSISAMTKTAGTFVRLCNAGGLYCFKRYELWQNGNQVGNSVFADHVFKNIQYYVNSDRYSIVSNNIGVDTTTNRNTAGTAGQTFALNLKHIFNLFAKPLDRELVSDDFEIRLYLRDSVVNVCQTDGTNPTFTITDMYLDLEYVEPAQSVMTLSREMFFSNDKKTQPMFYVENLLNQSTQLAGSVQATISLPELKDRNVIDITVIIRATSLLDAIQADYTDSLIPATSWNIKSNSLYLNGLQQDITSAYYQKVIVPRLKWLGIRNVLPNIANEFVIPFANVYDNETADAHSFHGSRLFTESDARMTINYSALAANADIYLLIRTAKLIENNNGKFRLY